MKIYQAMGIIAVCTFVLVGVVALLVMQGVHVLLAVLVVYLCAVWTMLSMQRKARESFNSRKIRSYCNSHAQRASAKDFKFLLDAHSVYQD